MQVKPLVPLRKVRILPSAPIATIVAAAPTFFGAALIALAIAFLSAAGEAPPELLLPAMGWSAAKAAGADSTTHPAISNTLGKFMARSP
ncbi:hypothetical protein ACFQ4S_14125 [Acinetobacter terrae]|uniref:hypothetical protein n=3 Tax=Acinetobacter terrae TaxID=2731247 RepID=UPI003645F434